MTTSVRSANADLVTCEIMIDGKSAPDAVVVRKIDVDLALNGLPWAQITIEDGDPLQEDFSVSASSDFVPGRDIEIKLGYHAKNTPVFRGVVASQTLRITADGNSALILSCADKAHMLTLRRTVTPFLDASHSDVMTALITDAGLNADVASTGGPVPQQMQRHASDWDWIVALARANGMVVSVSDGTVRVSRPNTDSPSLTAGFGDSIMDMDLGLSAKRQVTSVIANARDAATQSLISATSVEPNLNAQGNISGAALAKVFDTAMTLHNPAAMTQEALQIWADAHLVYARMSRFSGTVSFPGTAQVGVNTLLDLQGLGSRFNGAAFVAKVRHTVHEGEWQTTATIGLADAGVPDASDLTGLQITKEVTSQTGITLRLDDDKKLLSLETPGGHKLTLSDQDNAVTLTDSTGNRLKMSDSGIEMTSPRDIAIRADGSVTIAGQTGVDVKSPADVEVKGANATLRADMAAKVDGGATAELTGGVEAVVKGAMVMIN